MKKWTLGVLVLMLILAGCQATEEPQDPVVEEPPAVETPDEEPTEEPAAPETPALEKSETLAAFEKLLNGESTASDLGLFLMDHYGEATVSEAETMIEWLVIAQSDMIEAMNQKIYQPAYMNALNQDMGGVLDPDRVAEIQDPVVREDFQALVDAHLTIVRYEETPTIETDWSALGRYRRSVTEDFSEMLRFYARVQVFDYGRQDTDFLQLAEDTVYVGQMARHAERSFLSWQLNQLYQRQVGMLLVGPEGSYLDTFERREGGLYDVLKSIEERYDQTPLGRLITALDDPSLDTMNDRLDLIRAHQAYGFHVSYDFFRRYEVGGDYTSEWLEMIWSDHEEVADKVNQALITEVERISAAIDAPEERRIYMDTFYGNDRYVSIYVSINFSDADGEFRYASENLTLSLETGEVMTFADYLGLPDDAVHEIVLELTGVDYIGMPGFTLSARGISLSGEVEGETYEQYVFISLWDLSAYIDPQNHYTY